MKTKNSLILAVSALVSAAAALAQDPAASAPSAPAAETAAPATAPQQAAPAPAFTDAQLLEEFGWFMGKRVGVSDLDFTPAEVDQLIKGVAEAASGKDTPYELTKIGPSMDTFMQKKLAVVQARLKSQNATETTAFLDKLKDDKNIVVLPDGLRYEIVKPGEGDYPKPGQTVKVHYTGRLINGTIFDSSIQRGTPAEFALDQVIPGWTEGLQKINKGGKIKLYIPPELAYGDERRDGIPPGSMLVFDVELLDIKSPAAPAAAPAPASAEAPAPAPASDAAK